MFDLFIEYIKSNSSTPFSERDIEMIRSSFIYKKFRKRQFMHVEGEVCKKIAFIVKGAMRQYSIDSKGVEHVVGLMIENWWAGDRESFENQIPSKYYVDAWEDTETFTISREALNTIANIPIVQEMKFKISSNNAIALLERLNANISLNAEERLAEFEKHNPEFLQRFPQHLIASYLGMTKETLSRIRSQYLKK